LVGIQRVGIHDKYDEITTKLNPFSRMIMRRVIADILRKIQPTLTNMDVFKFSNIYELAKEIERHKGKKNIN
jgi:hypothetical protein